MSKDALVVGVAGVFFGVLVGWIIGTQQAVPRVAAPASAAPAQSSAASTGNGQPAPPPLDEAKASSMKTIAQQNTSDAETRVELGNMYFDAGRYQEAVSWYEQAVKLRPKDANVSNDLGISYYYMNDLQREVEQFDKSVEIDPKHAKTLLNIGIVRAFGKQDMKGAAEVWQKILVVAPGSEEAQAAKQALDGLRSAHPDLNIPKEPGD